MRSATSKVSAEEGYVNKFSLTDDEPCIIKLVLVQATRGAAVLVLISGDKQAPLRGVRNWYSSPSGALEEAKTCSI